MVLRCASEHPDSQLLITWWRLSSVQCHRCCGTGRQRLALRKPLPPRSASSASSGSKGGTTTAAHPPSSRNASENALAMSAESIGPCLASDPDPSIVSKKHEIQHAELTLLRAAAGQASQQPGPRACLTALTTRASTQLWFTVRLTSATLHQQSSVLPLEGHSPAASVLNQVPSIRQARSSMYFSLLYRRRQSASKYLSAFQQNYCSSKAEAASTYQFRSLRTTCFRARRRLNSTLR